MTRGELLAAYAGWQRDFRGADLSGANLSGVNLSGAYLSGADLSGAKGIVFVYGFDKRGYTLYRVQWADGPRFRAGCRFFAEAEARAHWGGDTYPDKDRGQIYIRAIDFLNSCA